MSRVYFHSPVHDTAELSGSERAHMACLCEDIFMGVVGDIAPFHNTYWLKQFFPPSHYIHTITGDRYAESARVALRGGRDDLIIGGKPTDAFGVMMNTACTVGNDVIRLMARLHAQCELHCWIEGQDDKTWVTGIIERGLKTGMMRDDEGWDDVLRLLREPDDSAVVCSFSVSDSFPNFGLLPEDHPLKMRDDDERWDEFYDIDDDEQWDICFKTLKESGKGLQLTREGWGEFFFNDGSTAFTMLRQAREA